MKIRLATAGDLEQLVALRMCMFREVDSSRKDVGDELEAVTRDYFAQPGIGEHCQTWVAERDGTLVATGTLVLFCRAPYPGNLVGREAYLFNLFTNPSFRRQGCARAIFESLMKCAVAWGCGKVWLHASESGRPLYLSAGFAPASTYLEWLPS